MGTLRSAHGEEHVLLCRTLVGRSAIAHLRLTDSVVSSEHAMVWWERGAWRVKDLASLNGTFVNATLLLPGKSCALAIGDVIAFGAVAASWTIASEAEPQPAARPIIGGPTCFGRGGILLLPNEDAPEIAVFERGGRWTMDAGGTVSDVASGYHVQLPCGAWDLSLPDLETVGDRATAAAPLRMERLSLHFLVSADEEDVVLTVRDGAIERSAPEQACLYTLLTLARRRQTAEEAGWVNVDELAYSLRCTREKLNVDIHRLRRLFENLGVANASQIVERRNVHEVRCGGATVVVRRAEP